MRRVTLVALAASLLMPPAASAQRLAESRFYSSSLDRPAVSFVRQADEPEEKNRPNGMQVVVGYMGAVLVGFLAWRAFDEPAGHHARVKDDWGYTPKANVAFGVGSFVGATLAVWGTGRYRGATGTLLGTAIGVAIPTIPILMQNDDPLLPLMVGIFGAPAQGILGYLGYKITAKK